jgi:endonuclease-3
LREKALAVSDRLAGAYGWRRLLPRREPLHELIATMLSHRTTQKNEALAFELMLRRFGSWEAVAQAPTDALAEAISPANFAATKAANIKTALARIRERAGGYSLEFLRGLPAIEALNWLTSLPGVGIKTASLVLLFCFGKPLLPVDSHVHRVSQRLGLIGAQVSPGAAHLALLALFPPDARLLYNFHVSMLHHGQRVCTWRRPAHERCPLTDLCDLYLSEPCSAEATSDLLEAGKSPDG